MRLEEHLKYLKMKWNRKMGRANNDFKKGGQAGSKGGCLKKEGLEPPYKLWVSTRHILISQLGLLLNCTKTPSKLYTVKKCKLYTGSK